jgi:hypothetical protein
MQISAVNAFWFDPNRGDIVKRSFSSSFSLRADASRTGNCRNLLTPASVRREALAERLEKQWHELLLHATIERDPEKMLRLTAKLDQCKRRVEPVGKRNGNF